MSIRSALWNGCGECDHHPQAMGVIGAPPAGTAALDPSFPRTLFSFLFPNNLSSTRNPNRAERDAALSRGNTLFSQMILEDTISDSGLAVKDDRFFVFRDAGDDTAYDSRASAFGFDHNGYLINAEGLRRQGRPIDPIRNPTFSSASPIAIQVGKAEFLAAPRRANPPTFAANPPLAGEVAIDSTGMMVASSRSHRINIARLVPAKFQNARDLHRAGAKCATASAEAGAIRIGLPGAGLGQLVPQVREQAALDMSQEFVKQVVTRRGFRANPHLVATVDDMLNALINRTP